MLVFIFIVDLELSYGTEALIIEYESEMLQKFILFVRTYSITFSVKNFRFFC